MSGGRLRGEIFVLSGYQGMCGEWEKVRWRGEWAEIDNCDVDDDDADGFLQQPSVRLSEGSCYT